MRNIILISAILLCGCQNHKVPELIAPESLDLFISLSTAPAICSALHQDIKTKVIALQRTFFDDFDDLNLQSDRWVPHYDGGYNEKTKQWQGYNWKSKRTLEGNQEQQIYVDPDYKGSSVSPLGLNPFLLDNGILSIVAQKTPPKFKKMLYGYEYISGVLTSRQSFVQKYGYFEMRARIPTGKALWPGFWLLPADKSWPPEIDIVEVVGQQPELIVSTIHYKDDLGNHKSSGCRTKLLSASNEFHLYGALWTPEKITYFIDRKPVAEILTPSNMDKPMYILLNLAVGGNMVGRADEETPMPSEYEIDWVTAYQLISEQKH